MGLLWGFPQLHNHQLLFIPWSRLLESITNSTMEATWKVDTRITPGAIGYVKEATPS